MKKLKLDLEALEVDSFEPAPETRLRATVHGREWWSEPDCQPTEEPQLTCAATCAPSCRSCVGYPTCDWTCSCDTYCGTPSCVNTCGCEPY